jgi:D-lactate dehydrogenase
MRVAFFGYEPWEKEYVEQALEDSGVEVTFFDRPLTSDSVPDDTSFDAVSVFVDSSMPREVLEQFANLQAIATRSTGFDHIDLSYCQEHNITVSNVPSYGENTVAEFTMALMLTLSRRVYEGYHRLRETGDFNPHGLEGFDLQGRTLGIIGTGHIGAHVAKMAYGFSMNIMAHDPSPNESLTEQYGVTFVSLEELLAESDVISVHVPHNDATHHMLGEEQFQQMKDGVFLINPSRGAVLDTQALVNALHSGKVAGAALDVLEEEGVVEEGLELLVSNEGEHNMETVLANYKLIDMPNVIVTPHMAFNSRGAKQRILDTTVHNFHGFASGEPVNVVS